MSLCRNAGRVLTFAFSCAILRSLLAGTSLAQNTSKSKAATTNIRKWTYSSGISGFIRAGRFPLRSIVLLHPCGMKLHDIPQGVGTSLTYNFNRFLGLEGDYGGNWNKYGNESHGSIGPRLMLRGDGVNFFVHTLLSYNRLTVKGSIQATVLARSLAAAWISASGSP